MNCSLLDLVCHSKSAALSWWRALDWPVQVLIVLGVALIVAGILYSVLGFVKRIGGWPAVGGAVLLFLAAVLAVFWPKKLVDDPIEHIPENHPDGRMPRPQKPKVAVRKHRPVFTDLFKPKD